MLSPKEIRKIAGLARIKLTPEEEKKFSTQLSAILDYVKVLEEVDTADVAPTAQVTGLQNVLGKDIVREKPLAKPKELLACSRLPKEKNQVKVRKVI